MRHTVLGMVVGAGLMMAAVSLGGEGGRAIAQRPTTVPEASAGLIALPTPLGEGRQMLTVIDPRTQAVAVYQVDAVKGEIVLKGVRKIQWDLQIEEFNGAQPLPSEVRSLVEPR